MAIKPNERPGMIRAVETLRSWGARDESEACSALNAAANTIEAMIEDKPIPGNGPGAGREEGKG